jgi:hypothetical protein
MGVNDTLTHSSDPVSKGFSEIRGSKEYVICKHGNRILCFFYSGDAGKNLISHYLKNNKIKKETTKLEVKLPKSKDIQKENLKIILMFFQLYKTKSAN